MSRLQGKSAIVTGGASGIGKAIAQLFLENGADVLVVDLANLESVQSELSSYGNVETIKADVRSMSDAQAAIEKAVAKFGKLDVLVCNAGITSVSPIEQLEEDEWDRVLDTNVKGMYTMIKSAIPELKKNTNSSIITLGSEMGLVAVPESPVYNASKGAVHMLTKSLALDLIRYGIRVNSLAPGITRTPLLQAEVDNSNDPAKIAALQAAWAPILRIADAKEIAQGALFLASDESSFAVGSILVLDGGFTAQ
jgi:NAD(P)-dependent dehydrogenase (short-subunit alcohol dehydrogenase family)|eukprot:gene1272-1287_t